MCEPHLSIIVVNYNTAGHLCDCLRSVYRETRIVDAEIIVVDNNSPDGSADMVRREYPRATLIANALNLGFSKGVNQGLKAARGELALVLNADVVAGEGSIEALVRCMRERPDVGMCAAKLLNPDGSVQLSCRTFYTLRIIMWRRSPLSRLYPEPRFLRDHLMSDWDHGDTREVDWFLGACMCVRMSAVREVGGMDERYFLYLEDVDWCYRFKRAGWKVLYNAGAHMVHHHLQASRRGGFNRDYFTHFFSMLRFYDKWSRALFSLRRHAPAIVGALFVALDIFLLWAAAGAARFLRHVLAGTESGGALLDSAVRGTLSGLVDAGKPVLGVLLGEPLVLFGAVLVLLIYARRLYSLDRSRNAMALGIDLLAALLGAVALSGVVLSFREEFHLYSRFVAMCTPVLFFPPALLARVAWVGALRWLGRQRLGMRRVLLVGTGETARALAARLSDFPGDGHEVVGYVRAPGDPPAEESAGDQAVLGGLEALPEIIERERVQEVVFTDAGSDGERAVASIIMCRRALVDVKVVLSGYASMLLHRGEEFFGLPVLRLDRRPSLALWQTVKDGADFFVGVALLAIAAPLIAVLTAALFVLHGRGLRRVSAVGYRGHAFDMLILDTGDPEKPAPGGFRRRLRASNLDDLPKLINVLRGDMSLIGPRPLSLEEAARLDEWQRPRMEMRPGITGLWQVNQGYKSGWDDMLRLDLYYVQNWSPLLDLRIAALSLRRAFFGVDGRAL